MSTCRDVTNDFTALREASADLSPWRRAGLRFHLFICPFCRRYEKQMDATVDALRDAAEPLSTDATEDVVARVLRARTGRPTP